MSNRYSPFTGERFRCPICTRMIKLTNGERLSPHGVGWRCRGSLTAPER